jgi:uncharacterized membrane protein
MESKARLLGHSIHQMLVVFPLGLLATAVVFDIIYIVNDAPVFSDVGFWVIVSGLIGGALAAPFGLIDWLGIPRGTRAKRVGAVHGLGNAVVLSLFLISALLRAELPTGAPVIAYVCSFGGATLALFTAWLGGELVSRLGVGVYERANLDAPSSLHREPRATPVTTPR